MHRRPGFTLIELLIVMVIIGLLAAIAMSVFWDAKDQALVRSMTADLRNLAAQQEVYYPDSFTYGAALAAFPEYVQSPGVDIVITYAAYDGWAAQATHSSYNGSCGIFVGAAPAANGAPATVPGVITCD